LTIIQTVEKSCSNFDIFCFYVFSGDEGMATPFTDVGVEDIATTLHKYGYQSHGNEVMYNGHTGRRMTAQIFIGPTYYQVQTQMRPLIFYFDS
jgi:DNA-directed RNA polymerase beta subunit